MNVCLICEASLYSHHTCYIYMGNMVPAYAYMYINFLVGKKEKERITEKEPPSSHWFLSRLMTRNRRLIFVWPNHNYSFSAESFTEEDPPVLEYEPPLQTRQTSGKEYNINSHLSWSTHSCTHTHTHTHTRTHETVLDYNYRVVLHCTRTHETVLDYNYRVVLHYTRTHETATRLDYTIELFYIVLVLMKQYSTTTIELFYIVLVLMKQ